MIISLQNEKIELTRELEIVLIISDGACVDNLIHNLKSNKVESDVYWMRDPLQFADYLDSKGSYKGRTLSERPKLYVLDSQFGIESYEYVSKKITEQEQPHKTPLYVLSRGLSDLEKEIFTYKGIKMINDKIIDRFTTNQQANYRIGNFEN
jgi:hypothetical protein